MAIKLVVNHQNSPTSLKDIFTNHILKHKANFFNICHIVELDTNLIYCQNSFPNIWGCSHKVKFCIHKILVTAHISTPTFQIKLYNLLNKLFNRNYHH